jgi:hypothetical protein
MSRRSGQGFSARPGSIRACPPCTHSTFLGQSIDQMRLDVGQPRLEHRKQPAWPAATSTPSVVEMLSFVIAVF